MFRPMRDETPEGDRVLRSQQRHAVQSKESSGCLNVKP